LFFNDKFLVAFVVAFYSDFLFIVAHRSASRKKQGMKKLYMLG